MSHVTYITITVKINRKPAKNNYQYIAIRKKNIISERDLIFKKPLNHVKIHRLLNKESIVETLLPVKVRFESVFGT